MNRYLVPCLAVLAALTACAGGAGPAGPAGADAAPCTVVSTGEATRVITCPGSAPVTVSDGAPGTSCTVTGGGTPVKTISCTDGTSVTVSDGAPCTATDNGDGTKTLACPGSAPVLVRDGTRCSVVDNQDGTSILSCTDGSRAVLAAPLETSLDAWQDLPGAVVTVAVVGGASNADGTFASGDRVAVTFTVRTAAGRLVPLRDLDALGAWLAGPTHGYQHVLPAARDATMYADVRTAATLNDDGSSTYVFPDPIPSSFGVPLYDTARFSDGELSGPLAAGTYTVGLAAWKGYTVAGTPATDAGSASHDVLVDHAAALEPRAVVGDASCAACHGGLRVHGGAFRGVALCVTCHTAGAEDAGSADAGDATPVTIELSVLLHKLHDAAHLPSVQGVSTDPAGARVYGAGTPYVVGATDYSTVAFPRFPNFNVAMPRDAGYSLLSSANRTKEDLVRRGVTDCAACHLDPAAAMAAPSRRACGACHDDLDYTRPYVANGQTMPANAADGTCAFCHPQASLQAAHLHPLLDPAVAPGTSIVVSSLGGASGPGGTFLAGDPLTLTFRIEDAAGADVPITRLDNLVVQFTGPTQARQVVVPGLPGNPIDTIGRFIATTTAGKGTMSKVQPGGTLVSETLTVEFTSATAFTVTGTSSGALASAALPGAPGTYPAGASLGNVVLTPEALPQAVTVTFTSPTTYTVTGAASGALGSGTLVAATSTTQRFTSTDGTLAFNLVLGSTSAAAGNTFHLAVVKGGAANPVLFAVVGGRTAFAAGDRFYFDLVAPAPSYTLALPMDIAFEFLGRASGAPGDAFTAANLPVRYGRQTLLERTASPGAVMTTSASVPALGRWLPMSALDAGLAVNDSLVVDEGTANEEYVRVGAIDAVNRRIGLTSGAGANGYLSNPLRFAHPAGATVREVTLTFRQEGVGGYYTLDPATGTVTINGATTAGNAFVLSYRTDARLGWKRRLGDVVAPTYYSSLADDPALDETWGDWRGKPLVDGTYTASVWGYRTIEHRSGGAAGEWQSYRSTTRAATLDVAYGATGTAAVPYSKLDDAEARCGACHGELLFHGGSRRGTAACLQCHATPGPGVSFRTLLHQAHALTLPIMPNGSARCAACHGATDVTVPTSRSHPTAQGRPALDWTLACGGCHAATSALAHFETMTAPSSGYEACATCHGAGRERPVEAVHRSR